MIRLILISCKFFYLHLITTFVNNRRQLNDKDFTTPQTMILRLHCFCQARSKIFSWKLRAYYGYLRENIYN